MTERLQSQDTDLIVFGTGQFAARIVFDLAATTREPVRTLIVGRNGDRLDWLVTAANARASMFGSPSRFAGAKRDVTDSAEVTRLLAQCQPRLAVQTASSQPSAVIGEQGNAWSALVAAGGLSVTAVAQSMLSLKVGEAIQAAGVACALINCCFPDVVNAMLEARGIEVLCGTGNVAILSNAFNGTLADRRQTVRVLAHYQQLSAWRQPATERGGVPPRVWIDGEELPDVYARFAALKLTREPAIEISGASGVTLMQAYLADREWHGHAPGPNGLPGGYPVRLSGRRLSLDLPEGLRAAEAIAWNAAFEQKSGLVVEGTRAHYTGRLQALLAAEGFAHADGFDVMDLERVGADLDALRARLEAQPAPSVR
ncbi:hypothetical protein [Chelatococcus asaccharovorans]|uniref:hypothetical protein n=1 Tax=Chelatococcus asaccharovorans TaxID=28210 RepID=UPI00224C75A9|nr:hypothetical protein [Chelatococcus asaccharovorans]CAH1650791.1 conserved hypothetical protein [Chelatococcus asaccharovorans]CAH1692540.1 conserved hypothetical protein [Chelatococcus asaccharovorans]